MGGGARRWRAYLQFVSFYRLLLSRLLHEVRDEDLQRGSSCTTASGTKGAQENVLE